ncbi:MAG TPA: glycosyltransferase family 2 protein [Planctomycetaceae bacterium]|nr:glycosyltransferase family 2 protein [Planctomycetaceae bacterium]
MTACAEQLGKASIPLVSVVIPTFNRAEMLRTAVRSVQAQTWPNVEIIIVDDGSTDNTDRVVRSLSCSLGNVRFVRQPHRGHGASRNAGLEMARGEWVLFLDDDDLLEPRCIETLLDAALSSNSPVVACRAIAFETPPAVTDPSQLRAGEPMVTTWHLFGVDLPAMVTIDELALRPLFQTAAALFRRQVLEEVEGFDEHLPGAEDYDCWFKILAVTGPFPLIEASLVWVRIHPHQTSAALFMMSEATHQVLSRVVSRHPTLEEQPEFRRRMARLCRENAYAALQRGDGKAAARWCTEGLRWSRREWKLWIYGALARIPTVFPHLVRWKHPVRTHGTMASSRPTSPKRSPGDDPGM